MAETYPALRRGKRERETRAGDEDIIVPRFYKSGDNFAERRPG
jgi:hypothetical protein